jgi:hypothetical protein
MSEIASRRQQIDQLRRRAEGHRRVALGLGSSADADAVRREAHAIELEAARLEADLHRYFGGP